MDGEIDQELDDNDEDNIIGDNSDGDNILQYNALHCNGYEAH